MQQKGFSTNGKVPEGPNCDYGPRDPNFVIIRYLRNSRVKQNVPNAKIKLKQKLVEYGGTYRPTWFLGPRFYGHPISSEPATDENRSYAKVKV